MKYLNYISLFLFAIILLSCTELEESQVSSTIDDYQLLSEYGEETQFWIKKHIVDYFVMVALGSEYGANFEISRRWHSDMNLYVMGDYEPFLLEELELIISEINDLSQDGFKIELVEHEDDSNFIAYLGPKEKYNQLFPGASDLVEKNNGLFRLELDKFVIVNGHLFVNTELPFQDLQKHLLREELTQSLGLGNDINYYPNSIFYEQPSRVTQYSINDKEIIRLLYHPNMIAGLSEKSVRSILGDILGI